MNTETFILYFFSIGLVALFGLSWMCLQSITTARDKEWMQWAADYGFTESEEFDGFPEYGYKGKHQ